MSDLSAPTHVCVICYQSAGRAFERCARCGALLVSLETPGVVEVLRAKVRQRVDKAARRQLALGLALAAAVGVLALVLANRLGAQTGRDRWTFAGPDASVWLEFWPLVAGFLVALVPALWLGGKVFPSPPGAERFRPEVASAGELVEWLKLSEKTGGAR